MNFVADESCAGPVIRALREAGHDVIAIAEVAKGATDDQVLTGYELRLSPVCPGQRFDSRKFGEVSSN